MFHLTRIAPTPSGFLHLGNVYSFALTSAIAKRTGADVLLRIDDMDQGRMQPEYVQDIFDTLQFLGIGWQQGPRDAADFRDNYSQLARLPLYHKYLQQLADSGLVFACTCSRSGIQNHSPGGNYPGTCLHKKIPLDAPGANWRLHTDNTAMVTVKRWNENAVTMPLPADMHYMIVRKKDGRPSYQLCSLADDVHFGCDLVVRGNDLLHSTLAQLYLARQLELKKFEEAAFFHHHLLLSAAKEKLSKSAGDTSVQHLRRQGKEPAAIFNAIACMAGIDQAVNNAEQLAAAVLHF